MSDDDPLGPLPRDVTTLARGAAALGVDGLDGEQAVLVAALRHFFAEHESLRHAAVAERYDATGMSTGLAATLAGVETGGAVEDLLRSHGVEPRVGPATDADRRAAATAWRVVDTPDEGD